MLFVLITCPLLGAATMSFVIKFDASLTSVFVALAMVMHALNIAEASWRVHDAETRLRELLAQKECNDV